MPSHRCRVTRRSALSSAPCCRWARRRPRLPLGHRFRWFHLGQRRTQSCSRRAKRPVGSWERSHRATRSRTRRRADSEAMARSSPRGGDESLPQTAAAATCRSWRRRGGADVGASSRSPSSSRASPMCCNRVFGSRLKHRRSKRRTPTGVSLGSAFHWISARRTAASVSEAVSPGRASVPRASHRARRRMPKYRRAGRPACLEPTRDSCMPRCP